jgi:conjugative transposon TraJ protein
MNGVLKPVEVATREMSKDSHKAILYNISEQQKAIKDAPPVGCYPGGNEDTEKYEQPDGTTGDEGIFSGLKNAFSLFNIKSMIKVLISEITQTFYAAAALCINTIRTFYLVVLVILGPLVLGLSVFDGFQHTLPSWFARYINVYMWLPVANIFGAICSKILENMLTLDQGFASTTAYIIFMIISVIGYATVPNVAGYIIEAGGKDTLLHKVTDMSKQAGMAAAGKL